MVVISGPQFSKWQFMYLICNTWHNTHTHRKVKRNERNCKEILVISLLHTLESLVGTSGPIQYLLKNKNKKRHIQWHYILYFLHKKEMKIFDEILEDNDVLVPHMKTVKLLTTIPTLHDYINLLMIDHWWNTIHDSHHTTLPKWSYWSTVVPFFFFFFFFRVK